MSVGVRKYCCNRAMGSRCGAVFLGKELLSLSRRPHDALRVITAISEGAKKRIAGPQKPTPRFT